jgi:hypothetical protein
VKIVVRGGKAVAENLSRYQTLLDGVALASQMVLASGQRLSLGKSTVVRFEEIAGEAAGDEAATGACAAAGAPTGEHTTDVTGSGLGLPAGGHTGQPTVGSKTMVMATGASSATGGDALSQAGMTTGGNEGDGATRAMMTRVVGQDELSFLRHVERQRARNRMLLIAAAVLVVGIVAILIAVNRPEKEKTISWPADALGDPIQGRVDSPMGGFALIYPKTGDEKVSTIAGGVLVTCKLGRRHDVPFRLSLEEIVEDRYVQETMEQSVARWKAQVATDGAKWNIDNPLPMNLFIGGDNGILFKTLPYQRQGDGSWAGMAVLLRHGRRFIVVRAEVPSADRARAEEMLARSREELRRTAPATWSDVEAQIIGAMRKSVVEKNTESEKEAMEMLVALRAKKALWYNEQLCQKEAALAQGDTVRVRKIAEMCKTVFSDVDDQRFYEVRKW